MRSINLLSMALEVLAEYALDSYFSICRPWKPRGKKKFHSARRSQGLNSCNHICLTFMCYLNDRIETTQDEENGIIRECRTALYASAVTCLLLNWEQTFLFELTFFFIGAS